MSEQKKAPEIKKGRVLVFSGKPGPVNPPTEENTKTATPKALKATKIETPLSKAAKKTAPAEKKEKKERKVRVGSLPAGSYSAMSRSGANAKARIDEKGCVVLKGSVCAKEATKSIPDRILTKIDELEKSGVIKDWVFAKDYSFTSTSTAASVVLQRSASGPATWFAGEKPVRTRKEGSAPAKKSETKKALAKFTKLTPGE